MQVFVPSDDLREVARVLDPKRLNKQLVECDQIMRVIRRVTIDKESGEVVPREPRGWSNHPAVLAWRNNVLGLYAYSEALVDERYRRGLTNPHKSFSNMRQILSVGPLLPSGWELMPTWWGREDVHASHRAALLFKDPAWYSQWGWTETPEYNYVWPAA